MDVRLGNGDERENAERGAEWDIQARDGGGDLAECASSSAFEVDGAEQRQQSERDGEKNNKCTHADEEPAEEFRWGRAWVVFEYVGIAERNDAYGEINSASADAEQIQACIDVPENGEDRKHAVMRSRSDR